MSDVTIAVDAMGGDRAPAETVAGAVIAAGQGIQVLLCGRREPIEAELGRSRPGIEILDAPDVIEPGAEPAAAVRAMPDSSLVAACRAVRDGRAQGAVSAGPTGAMMAACLLRMGRIERVSRPGIAVPLPARGAPCVLIDAGANADAKPLHLLQFGIMGSVFARDVLGVASPRVGLLSIGEESSKGTAVTQEAHRLLGAAPMIEFAGNCEGRDVLTGEFQVVVADGFTGNVLLKGLEGAASVLFGELRAAASSSLRGRLGGLLLLPALREVRDRTDPATYGGAYLLGVRGLAVVSHGNSGRRAIANAIAYAARGAAAGVVERTSAAAAESMRANASDLQDGRATRTVSHVAATEIGDTDDES